MNKKCKGTPQGRYPGLVMYSEIQTSAGDCRLAGGGVAEHNITVFNSSTLTFAIDCQSECDKAYLKYLDSDDPAMWKTTFPALWRWDDGPRESGDSTRIQAKPDVPARRDRLIDVKIDCKAEDYAPVGPFRIQLQIDHDG